MFQRYINIFSLAKLQTSHNNILLRFSVNPSYGIFFAVIKYANRYFMKRLFFLLSISLLLGSCGSLLQKFSKVKHQHDTFKQEYISIYEFDYNANSTWNKHRWHKVFLQVLKVEAPTKTTHKIYLNFAVSLSSKAQDTIYFKLDDQVYKIRATQIDYTEKHTQNTNTETEIVKEKSDKDDEDQKEKETVTTTTNTYQHDYLQIKVLCILPNDLVEKIKQANAMQIHFYENDEGYTLQLNKFYIDKIKEVFQ